MFQDSAFGCVTFGTKHLTSPCAGLQITVKPGWCGTGTDAASEVTRNGPAVSASRRYRSSGLVAFGAHTTRRDTWRTSTCGVCLWRWLSVDLRTGPPCWLPR